MPAGRKTKYTPQTAERILKAISIGASLENAAKAGGIVYETLRRWREQNSGFNADIEKAEGDAIVRRLARIEKAGASGKWQADAWWLERRYPQEWGRTIQEHQGKDGAPIAVELIEVIRNKNSGDSNS